VAQLIRLAAFQNPEFYRAQAMRRSTYDFGRWWQATARRSHYVANRIRRQRLLMRLLFRAALLIMIVGWIEDD
jgi:hypothetical protein